MRRYREQRGRQLVSSQRNDRGAERELKEFATQQARQSSDRFFVFDIVLEPSLRALLRRWRRPGLLPAMLLRPGSACGARPMFYLPPYSGSPVTVVLYWWMITRSHGVQYITVSDERAVVLKFFRPLRS